MKLAKRLGVSLSQKDLDESHRTNNKDDAPIIVKFDSRRARDIFYDARKTLRTRKITSSKRPWLR